MDRLGTRCAEKSGCQPRIVVTKSQRTPTIRQNYTQHLHAAALVFGRWPHPAPHPTPTAAGWWGASVERNHSTANHSPLLDPMKTAASLVETQDFRRFPNSAAKTPGFPSFLQERLSEPQNLEKLRDSSHRGFLLSFSSAKLETKMGAVPMRLKCRMASYTSNV